MSQKLSLRPFQQHCLQILQRPGHLICISATGSGKSLIYERHILLSQERSILFTPLIALARQQEQQLLKLGIKVTLWTGSRGKVGRNPNQSQVWIVSPEHLRNPQFKLKLKQWDPQLLVSDECHCIWDWSDQFRPAFQDIIGLIQELKIQKSIWLTATLPPEAYEQLKQKLPQALILHGQFSVPEKIFLKKTRVALPHRPETLMRKLSQLTGKGIIFTNTRQSTTKLHNLIKGIYPKSMTYHAGLSQEERNNIETLFRNQEIPILVSTSAFGMGMDVAHLRWTILYHPPFSLLGLAQSMGRVGRSGRPGLAICFWHPDDFALNQWAVRNQRQGNEYQRLYQFYLDRRCIRKGLEASFCLDSKILSNLDSNCGYCSACVDDTDRRSIEILSSSSLSTSSDVTTKLPATR